MGARTDKKNAHRNFPKLTQCNANTCARAQHATTPSRTRWRHQIGHINCFRSRFTQLRLPTGGGALKERMLPLCDRNRIVNINRLRGLWSGLAMNRRLTRSRRRRCSLTGLEMFKYVQITFNFFLFYVMRLHLCNVCVCALASEIVRAVVYFHFLRIPCVETAWPRGWVYSKCAATSHSIFML